MNRHLAGLLWGAGFFLILSLALIAMWRRDWFGPLDQAAFAAAAGMRSAPLTAAMTAVTQLGGGIVLAPLGLLAAALLFVNGYRSQAAAVLIALLGSELLNEGLKHWFARPRPIGFNLIERPDSYSFPSGHAMVSPPFYAMLAHLLRGRLADKAWSVYITPAGVLLIVLIAASRVYLGVHYLSDVLTGLCLGACWYCLVRYGLEAWGSRPRPQTVGPVTPAQTE
ncbi:phosphatase PAP2 family protein [Brevibacillus thermoruber]|uniref:phosphatase PAP2 family protein n=1 Tax=Brevibacillus thermoruber TaxID=33942 RepID=UPI0003FAD0DD|nr:phosphatase PAP2 family protein [Brevibacillus thermoruber]